MAIRAFLCRWTESQNGEFVAIENPIDQYLNDVSLSDPSVVGINFYARLSQAKRPNRLYMLKIIRGNLTTQEWNSIGAITGVRMSPAFKFSTPVSAVPTNVRSAIRSALDSVGCPRSVYDSAPTVGAFLRNLTAELNPDRVGFGGWELSDDEWA